MNNYGRIMPTDSPAAFEAAVREAVALLKTGQVVALPTETVYGLAGNGLNPAAVERIFAVKGRPSHNPIIIHVASLQMAQESVCEWPEVATRLAEAFWPGPLTLVMPRSHRIPDIVTAGGATVGVRWPSHPFMQAVIRLCGFPLAAPSANRSNELSPTNAEHVRKSLGDLIPLIVDGGRSQVGIESTVLDLSSNPPRILRPGIIHAESLVAVTGEIQTASQREGETLRSPGQLLKHYSPKAQLLVWQWNDEKDLAARMVRSGISNGNVHVIAHDRIPMSLEPGRISVIPYDAEAYARAIYAELHRCDEEGAEIVIVEALPDRPEWAGVADRLRRASA